MGVDIINAGDKIDIRGLQQRTEEEGRTALIQTVYKSKVQDIKEDGLLEITMPMCAGKMVLLSAGVRYECTFYTRNGLYRCVAQVKERYKTEHLYMLLMEPKSPLEKVQRREYFRFECVVDVDYYKITEDEAKIEDLEELKQRHKEMNPESEMNQGIAVDLSGGGVRFVAEEEGKKDEFVFLRIFLPGLRVGKYIEIAGRVLSCKRREETTRGQKYEYRVQFLTRDQKKREIIIKYIFEQERKNRQKG